MGSWKPAPNREYIETGSEPEYFVTDMRTEDAGGGNVRIFAYSLRHHKQLHLLYTAIIPAAALILMGRQCLVAGTEGHNSAVWEGLTEQ